MSNEIVEQTLNELHLIIVKYLYLYYYMYK